MRAASLLPLVALLAAACGNGYEAPPASRAVTTVTSYAPASFTPASAPIRFDDLKPHEWIGRSPGHYPVHGIDVSKYQAEIDWPTVRASGISFAFIKATEGGDHLDDRFALNWAGARAAGVPRGAYHFYYFCRPALQQAEWFLAHVPREPGALPPVLDMEWNHQSRTCPHRPDAETVRREMRIFLDYVGRHFGKRPLVYTTVDFYRDNALWQLGDQPFWLRSVAGHPSEVYPGQPWAFWQYTGTGVVPGIAGPTDINTFAGSPADWQAWLVANAR